MIPASEDSGNASLFGFKAAAQYAFAKRYSYKPLGSEVIAFSEAKNSAILYNITVKRTFADQANGSQPSFALMSDILIEQLKKVKLPLKRVSIQSFDAMVLEYTQPIKLLF